MNYKIIVTDFFKVNAKFLKKKYPSLNTELDKLYFELISQPTLGTPLGKNIFKIRLKIKSKGKGKSGGARVITYVYIDTETIFLLQIYDKSEASTVDIELLKKLVKNLKK